MNAHLEEIYTAILEGYRNKAQSGVAQALDAGVEPGAILTTAMIPAMQEVGRRYEAGDYFIPEMLISARAMQAGMALLKPRLAEADVQPAGRVVIGTVKGDKHDIGKNLVAMMLEGAGFEIQDMGTDVSPEAFVAAAAGADVIALSALLTTTMPAMQATIEALAAAGLRERVKVIVGGAPVTEGYARQIGADGYSPDASRAAALARSLLAG